MPLFSIEEAQARAAAHTRLKRASRILAKATQEYAPTSTYDIFLSHSYQDAQVILGVKLELEEMGLGVYVDWIEDPDFDRSTVTEAVAERLKSRMKNSSSLFFAASDKSPESKWMPWELGFFDGSKEKVAILPLDEKKSSTNYYHGQEYLGVYPYITRRYDDGRGTLFVHRAPLKYVKFQEWLKGDKPSHLGTKRVFRWGPPVPVRVEPKR